jgi:hypothetical protein
VAAEAGVITMGKTSIRFAVAELPEPLAVTVQEVLG